MQNCEVSPLDMKRLPQTRASCCTQFGQLFIRTRIMARREPQVVRSKVFSQTFIALLIMACYWNVGDPNSVTDYINMSGLIFAWSVQTLISWVFGSILTFQMERPVFLREQANQLYGSVPYYFAKIMIEVPISLLLPLLMQLIIYWSNGFKHSAEDFGKIYLVLVLLSQNAIGMGLIISSAANNLTVATSIAPLITMPNVLFGGMLANSAALPSYISWAQWLSVIRFANEAISTVEFQGVNWKTDYYLTVLGFNLGYWKCIYILAGYMVFWRAMSMIILRCMISKF